MRKLIGKLRQMFRRKQDVRVLRGTTTHKREYDQYVRRRRRENASFSSKDHVTHYHASGEDRYLCGKWYEPEFQSVGTHRVALNTRDLSCNRCQVIHNKLVLTPEGRARLGLDKKVPA